MLKCYKSSRTNFVDVVVHDDVYHKKTNTYIFQIVRYASKLCNVKPEYIFFGNFEDSAAGWYDSKKIVINMREIADVDDLFDAVLHEFKHLWQHCKFPDDSFWSLTTITPSHPKEIAAYIFAGENTEKALDEYDLYEYDLYPHSRYAVEFEKNNAAISDTTILIDNSPSIGYNLMSCLRPGDKVRACGLDSKLEVASIHRRFTSNLHGKACFMGGYIAIDINGCKWTPHMLYKHFVFTGNEIYLRRNSIIYDIKILDGPDCYNY